MFSTPSTSSNLSNEVEGVGKGQNSKMKPRLGGKINLQELRCGEEGASSQVHGVFEHEEEVEVTHQVPCQFIYKPAQLQQREEDESNCTETTLHSAVAV